MHRPILVIAQIFALLLLGSATAVHAQTKSAPTASVSAMPDIQGVNLKGEAFSKEQIKGKVAVVFFWSTDCTVCLNSLPELRANASGWRAKPFALVTVNVDRSAKDWAAYEEILAKMQAPTAGVISLRQTDAHSPLGKLPLTLLIDAKGKLISRFEGRLAPEIWDGVADLLP